MRDFWRLGLKMSCNMKNSYRSSPKKGLNCWIWKWRKMVETKKMKISRFWVFEMKVKKMVLLNLMILVGLHLCFF